MSLERLVRWGESKLKMDVRYVLAANGWLLLYQISVFISLAVMAVLFGRLLPQSVYGEYSFILSVAAILGYFSFTGFGTAVAQSTARGYEGSLYAAVRENLRWGALPVLAALLVAGYYLFEHNLPYALSFAIIGVTLPLSGSATLSEYFLLGKKNFKTRSLQKSLDVLVVAACMSAALFLHAGLVGLVATYFISRTIVLIFCYLWTTGRYSPANLRVEEGFIPHASSLSGVSLVAAFADQADSVFLFLLTGPVALAVYSFAVAPPELLKGLIKNHISSVSFPVFANSSPQYLRSHLLRNMAAGTAMTLALVGVYIVCAPALFRVFFPAYLDAVRYSQLFSLSLVFVAAAAFPITALRAMTATKHSYYRFVIVSEIFQTFSLLIGVRIWGIPGAIGAYTFVRVFRLLYALFLFYRHRE